jgi:abortive infection bacteriophage resistance protein
MKPYDKAALSYQQQVELMQSRRLQVRNPSEAAAFLSRVSYYRISTYFLPFQPERDRFAPGSNFDSIVELYRLDEELRNGLFAALSQVEIALRTRFVYGLAKGFPRLPLWMAVEVMSLGLPSTLYNGLLPEPRRRIIEGLGLAHPIFRSWLHF